MKVALAHFREILLFSFFFQFFKYCCDEEGRSIATPKIIKDQCIMTTNHTSCCINVITIVNSGVSNSTSASMVVIKGFSKLTNWYVKRLSSLSRYSHIDSLMYLSYQVHKHEHNFLLRKGRLCFTCPAWPRRIDKLSSRKLSLYP